MFYILGLGSLLFEELKLVRADYENLRLNLPPVLGCQSLDVLHGEVHLRDILFRKFVKNLKPACFHLRVTVLDNVHSLNPVVVKKPMVIVIVYLVDTKVCQ